MKGQLFSSIFFGSCLFLLISTAYAGNPPAAATVPPAPCTPVVLKCEYLSDPIGIDAPHPRLSRQLMDERQGPPQPPYRLYRNPDSEALHPHPPRTRNVP